MASVDSSNQKYTTSNYDCNKVEIRARYVVRLKSKHLRHAVMVKEVAGLEKEIGRELERNIKNDSDYWNHEREDEIIIFDEA